jgi:UDP:flavonoid glycosyltransferase YjiC (YdhE family)
MRAPASKGGAVGTFLMCATPVYGHVAPMLSVGRYLAGRGHRIRFLTGSRWAGQIAAAGMEHVPLPAEADYDDRDLEGAFPELAGRKGLSYLRTSVASVFIDPVPYQYQALLEDIRSAGPDAVLIDVAFAGILPLLLSSAPRPPVIACGVIPLTLSSRDCAPFGLGLAPLPGIRGRLRNAVLNAAVQHYVFRELQARTSRIVKGLSGRNLPVLWSDAPMLADHLLQFTVPGFEYPRRDLPAHVKFVGPVLPPASRGFTEPEWWPELQEARAVVHVSQGTVENLDLSTLIGPTLEGLAGEDLLVVATTGGRPASEIPGPVPPNVHVAGFLPYDRLLPHVDVMVTNGGYGGVQFALTHGVPLVVAGDTQEKPDIAARVQWSGTGINLRSGKPAPAAVAAAVHRVLDEPRYRAATGRLGAQLRSYDALGSIAAVVEPYADAGAADG